MVYFFNRLEFEVNKALVAACESFAWYKGCCGRQILLSSRGRRGVRSDFSSTRTVVGVVYVAATKSTSADNGVKESVGATCGWCG